MSFEKPAQPKATTEEIAKLYPTLQGMYGETMTLGGNEAERENILNIIDKFIDGKLTKMEAYKGVYGIYKSKGGNSYAENPDEPLEDNTD